MIVEGAIVVGLGVAGLLLWRWQAPGMERLRTEETIAVGGRFFVTAFLLDAVIGHYVIPFDGTLPGHLVEVLRWSFVATVAGIVVAMALYARPPEGLRLLGLHRQRGPNAVAVAVAAWLAFLPLLSLVGYGNEALLRALGVPDGLQESLRLFLDDDTVRRSPVSWLAIGLLLPVCEEVMFRGALYPALRRRLPAGVAIGGSALLFGLVHEPTAMLPAAALGVALTFLYERTGSLAAPIAFHALHNGLTLLTAALAPEMLS